MDQAVAHKDDEPAASEEPAPSEEPVRKDIADEKARYLWNAAGTAVSKPEAGGGPVPKMKAVCWSTGRT